MSAEKLQAQVVRLTGELAFARADADDCRASNNAAQETIRNLRCEVRTIAVAVAIVDAEMPRLLKEHTDLRAAYQALLLKYRTASEQIETRQRLLSFERSLDQIEAEHEARDRRTQGDRVDHFRSANFF